MMYLDIINYLIQECAGGIALERVYDSEYASYHFRVYDRETQTIAHEILETMGMRRHYRVRGCDEIVLATKDLDRRLRIQIAYSTEWEE